MDEHFQVQRLLFKYWSLNPQNYIFRQRRRIHTKTVHFHFHASWMISNCRSLSWGVHHTWQNPPQRTDSSRLVSNTSHKNKSFSSSSPPTPLCSSCRYSTFLPMLWNESQGDLHPGKILRVTSPPPILHPFNSDATHLISPVHQDRTLEIRYLDPFHGLAIQGLWEDPRHFHVVGDVQPPLVMM